MQTADSDFTVGGGWCVVSTVPLPWEDQLQIQLLLLLFSAESGERSAVGKNRGAGGDSRTARQPGPAR
jgi:hypothetical protein